jgi:glycosyltransferase involved in cell wall biosynthesis
MARLRIVVASLGDPASEETWSGTPRHLIDALAARDLDVIPVGVSSHWARPLGVVGRLRSRVSRDLHVYARHPLLLKHLNARFAAAMRRVGPVDLVVTLGSFPVAIPDDATPVITWIDATLDGLMGYYEDWSNWSPGSIRQFRVAEQHAMTRAGLVVAASEWAANTAQRIPGLPDQRVVVVPFGANLPAEVPRGPAQEIGYPVRLLSVGNRWQHKGMDIAVATAKQLNAGGVPTRLDIVGCEPPPGVQVPDYVTCHGFVSKETAQGRRRLEELYRGASLFLLASRSECFGVVFCEAAAYGLPVVAPRTGGIPTAVQHEVTGLLVTGGPESYAAAVRQIVETPERHRRMSEASRSRYERELNWDRATAHVLELARERGLVP